MEWQYSLYILPSVIAAVASAYLGGHIWMRQPAPGAIPLSLLMGLASFSCLVIVLGVGAQNQETAVLAWKWQYIFVEGVPLLWLVFCLQYAQQQWLTRKRFALLLLAPTIALILVFTNESHGLMWQNLVLSVETAVITWDPGPWYWVDIIYNYTLVAVGTIILLRQLRHFQGLYRFQLTAILVGIFIPWLINLLYQFMTIPAYIPLAPLGILASGIAFSWGIYRYRLFDVIPIAQELLVQEMHDPVLVVDPQQRLLHLNPAAKKLVHADTTSSFLGKSLTQLQPALSKKLRQSEPENAVPFVMNENGATRYYQVQRTPLYRRQQLLGQLFVLHDITALQMAREKAETALQIKTAFVSNVSHELRTPLTNILLNLDLIALNRGKKVDHYLKIIRQETERQRHLIEDLLQVSQLDAHKIQPKMAPIDLVALAQDLYADRQQLFIQNKVTLSVQLTPVPQVLGDSKLIEQVITNLLSNALNYTLPGGQVLLETAVAPTTPTGVELRVSDTGCGIPEHELGHIFERFVRGEASLQTGATGTGLGLAISQEIIEMHHGKLTVTSTVGQGSTFTIRLPAAP